MARSLAERLRAHEQQKARLAEQEARLKADERKARTRHLIQSGGLVDKAGLLELEPNALYGALLSLRERADDPEQVRQWATLGGRTFAREARLAEEGKEAIVLAFSAALGRDATTALRGIGFRFNKLLQHWEGLARFDEADSLATAHGGTARRVVTAEPPAPGSSPGQAPLPAADRAAE
jgi:conjugative transfer protein TraD